MISSAEEFVRLRTSTDPRDYERAAKEEAEEAVWNEIIRTYPEMRFWVVVNKTVSASILGTLSRDSDPLVRAAVARTRRTPPDVLRSLAADVDDATRMAVVMNPKTPSDILELLSGDPWSEVAAVAKERLSNDD